MENVKTEVPISTGNKSYGETLKTALKESFNLSFLKAALIVITLATVLGITIAVFLNIIGTVKLFIYLISQRDAYSSWHFIGVGSVAGIWLLILVMAKMIKRKYQNEAWWKVWWNSTIKVLIPWLRTSLLIAISVAVAWGFFTFTYITF